MAARMAAMFSIMIYLCIAMTVMCSIDNAVIELYAGDVSVLKIAKLTDKTQRRAILLSQTNSMMGRH